MERWEIGGRLGPPILRLVQFAAERLERRLRITVSVPPRSKNPLIAKLGSTSGAVLLVGLLPELLLWLDEDPKSQFRMS